MWSYVGSCMARVDSVFCLFLLAIQAVLLYCVAQSACLLPKGIPQVHQPVSSPPGRKETEVRKPKYGCEKKKSHLSLSVSV